MPRPGVGGEGGDDGRIPHHPPGRRAASSPQEHGRRSVGQGQAVRYESRRQVANTRVGGEGVHQSRVGKAPGNEVKVEYSEKSVLRNSQSGGARKCRRTTTDN